MIEKFKPVVAPPSNALERWKRWRRKKIKKFGKRLVRSLADFIGRQSLVGDKPVFATKDFDWAVTLEDNAETIRSEFERILPYRDSMPAFHELSPDQYKISQGKAWKTFVLFGFGYKAEANCQYCPETTRILESIPNLKTALFSILSPGTEIPAHRGITKGLIRCHLPIMVPRDRENCVIRIDDHRHSWEAGHCLVFDDTYEHEVWNRTGDDRVVLLIDVVRPMRFWGRIFNWAFLKTMVQTGYVKDAKRNAIAWAAAFDKATKTGADTPGEKVAQQRVS